MAPSHTHAQAMASQILQANGDKKELGKQWLQQFLGRNLSVASIVGKPIPACRINNTTPEILNDYFQQFKTMQLRYNIKHEDIWNIDKTGVVLGVCTNSQVLGQASKKHTYVKVPGNCEWVTVVKTISAGGAKIRPLVIFKGQAPQTSWFSDDKVPDWIYTMSENGWTDNGIAINWLNNMFLPETRRDNNTQMLVMDGHGSHATIDFQWICWQNQVYIVYLPAHASHVLQPLDLSCFSPVKSQYWKQIADLAVLDDAAAVKKHRFVTCYHKAREEGLTPRVVQAGWKASGMVPYNPQMVVNLSQVMARPRDVRTPSPPRKRTRNSTTIEFKTPRKPVQFTEAIQKLGTVDTVENLQRSARAILENARKATEEAIVRQAKATEELQTLEARLRDIKKQPAQRWVPVDPNTRFADVKNIRKAIKDKKKKQEERGRLAAQRQAGNLARDLEVPRLEDCMFEFQI